MLLVDTIPVFIIIGMMHDIADGCIWGRAREKIYVELKETDCHDNIDCNHAHEVVEQQFNNDMMLTSESGGSGLKDKRSLDSNGEPLEQKRAPIHVQPSFEPDLIERDKRETHGRTVFLDFSDGKENTYPAHPTNTYPAYPRNTYPAHPTKSYPAYQTKTYPAY